MKNCELRIKKCFMSFKSQLRLWYAQGSELFDDIAFLRLRITFRMNQLPFKSELRFHVVLCLLCSGVDPKSYLSMNLYSPHYITGVVTQGSGPTSEIDAWIETYSVLYSLSTKSHYLIPDDEWRYVVDEDGKTMVNIYLFE